MSTPPTFQGNLVGVQFRPADVRNLIWDMLVDDEVTLEREPDNAHDPNAIRVLHETGEFIGFIERGVAASLAQWLDQGYQFRATIAAPIEDKWKPWLIEIKPVEDDLHEKALDAVDAMKYGTGDS